MKTEEQEALDDLVRLFPTMACGEVQTLKQQLIDARGLYTTRKAQKIREMLPTLARLKKQSVSFGYPLVRDVVTHMEKIMQGNETFSESECNALHTDILLLQDILWKKIRGDWGERGRKILNRLVRIPK